MDDAGGDGADGFSALAAGEDGGALAAVADVGKRFQQRRPFVGGELAAGLLLEDLQTDRIEGVVLPLCLLGVGADLDQADERRCARLPFIKRSA